jgi:hypothetical protein
MIKSRKLRKARPVVHFGGVVNACKVLIRKTKGKRTLGRTKHIWNANIKIVRKEIRLESVD